MFVSSKLITVKIELSSFSRERDSNSQPTHLQAKTLPTAPLVNLVSTGVIDVTISTTRRAVPIDITVVV